jgi:hypothetical protein
MSTFQRGANTLALALATGCVQGGAAISTGSPPPKYGGAVVDAADGQPLTLPVSLVDGLFVAAPVTEETGVALRLLVSTTERALLSEEKATLVQGRPLDAEATSLTLPKMAWDSYVPESRGDDGSFLVAERVGLRAPRGLDGVLGRGFFEDRTVTFDFAAGSLLLREAGEAPFGAAYERINLRRVDIDEEEDAPPVYALSVSLGGRPHDLVLDLGARKALNEAQAALTGLPHAKPLGTCFLTAPVFDALRAAHPEWRAGPPEALDSEWMLEIPRVEVAGKSTGPAWFARDPAPTSDPDETSPSPSAPPRPVGRASAACLAKLALTIDFRTGLAVVVAVR